MGCSITRETYNGCPGRNVHMGAVLAVVPRKVGSEEASLGIETVEATVLLGIRIENDAVGALLLNTDAVVGVAVGVVEVEDKDQAGALKDDDLIALVLERDVGLWGVQPAVLVLGQVHRPVKVVEVLVTQKTIFRKVELAPGVPERVLVALTGEVKPLGVAELVAFKVEVTLTSQGMGKETDQLVQCHAAVNDRGQRREGRHVGVQLGIAEMHHEGLVTDEPV